MGVFHESCASPVRQSGQLSFSRDLHEGDATWTLSGRRRISTTIKQIQQQKFSSAILSNDRPRVQMTPHTYWCQYRSKGGGVHVPITAQQFHYYVVWWHLNSNNIFVYFCVLFSLYSLKIFSLVLISPSSFIVINGKDMQFLSNKNDILLITLSETNTVVPSRRSVSSENKISSMLSLKTRPNN